MPNNLKIEFPEVKQGRSEKTLDDILQAAEQIVSAANPQKFTSRTLAEKSGYALGTLSYRIGPIDNAFLWAIDKLREKSYENMTHMLQEFDDNQPLKTLIENIVDDAFKTIKRVNPKVIRFFEDRLTKLSALPPDFYTTIDILAKPFVETALRNQTHTFRVISEDEAILLLRTTLTIIRRPFIIEDPIAGTEEHRRIAIDSLVRLFGR